MNGLRLSFLFHLQVFLAAHFFVNACLLRGPEVPEPLLFLRESILEGRILYYHEPSSLFAHAFWTAGLAVHALFALSPFFAAFFAGGKYKKEKTVPASRGDADRLRVPEHKVILAQPPANPARAWWMVTAGGAMEIVWASGFKYPQVPSILVIAALLLSFDLLIRAAKFLPVGTVYAVFTGIGTLGTTAVEAVVSGGFGIGKLLLILLLLACIIGLKISGEERTG